MAELEIVRASHGEKAEAVAFVHEKFKTAKMAIVTEYRGLSVAQMTRLRRAIRDASGEYQVIKNTLVRRALKDTAYGSLDRLLDGPNGWVFAYDDPVMLSKALVKFADDNDKLSHQGRCLRGAVHGAGQGEDSGPDAEQARTSSEITGAHSGSGDSASSTRARTRGAGCQIIGNSTQGKIRVTPLGDFVL